MATREAPKPKRQPLTQAALSDRLAGKSRATKAHMKAILDELAVVGATDRQGRNLATGTTIPIPAGRKIKFSVVATTKQVVEGK